MEFSENLIRLRKSRGWSQEELGYKVDVSRQTVSKWETGDTTPEMGKLVKLSEIFGISMDSLVTDEEAIVSNGSSALSRGSFEYKSKMEINGWPLIHINLGRGLKKAKGVIAIGNMAVGLIAIGALSAGIISIGVLSAGLLAMGALTGGVISAGGLAAGYIAMGGVAMGYLAMGGVAMGTYALGGVSLARDIAVGGVAQGYIAIGESVNGTVEFITENNFRDINPLEVRAAIDSSFPDMPQWLKNLFTTY